MSKVVVSTTSPPEFDQLAATIHSQLPFAAKLKGCQALAGDASNRRYYRLSLEESEESEESSLILMQLAASESFKASEEAISQGDQDITELPFLNVQRHLQSLGISVPRLQVYDESAGLLFLEDFGDETLADACCGADLKKIEHLYGQAIETLVQIHLSATPRNIPTCIAFSRTFDVPLLMWEFEHFLEYGVLARQDKPIESADYAVIQEEFRRIAEFIAEQPQVFTHRDYHSRNLMVDGSRLGVIDFQDALLGPATYDLASLLRDSYIALDDHLIDHMIKRYIQGMSEGLKSTEQEAMLLTDPVAFRKLFDFTSMQRNLKAAGRFVYIDRVKHNPKFLADIPRTLGYVRRNLETYPELRTLSSHLSPYVPEWQ